MYSFNFNYTPSIYPYYNYQTYQFIPNPFPYVYNEIQESCLYENQRGFNQIPETSPKIDESAIKGTSNPDIKIQYIDIVTKTAQKKTKQSEESNYQPESQKIENTKDCFYKGKCLKKNTESNMCNQSFSYLLIKMKSGKNLKRILEYQKIDDEKVMHCFYEYMMILKNHKKKYVNKKFLIYLMTIQTNKQICSQIKKLNKEDILPIQFFNILIRKLLFNYLSDTSSTSILTSKKIDKLTLPDHFNRRRKILKFLQVQLSKQK